MAIQIVGPQGDSSVTVNAMREHFEASGERYAEMLAMGGKAGSHVGDWLSANRLLPQSVRMHPKLDLPASPPLSRPLTES